MKLLIASGNENKIREIQALVPPKIKCFSLADIGFFDEIPENESTIEANSMAKARYSTSLTKEVVLAEDTGLEVHALNGAPGVHSKRYASEKGDAEANMQLLLKNLDGKSDRSARFKTVITLILKSRVFQFTGLINGTISKTKSGNSGFGYDPVFIPERHQETFADLGQQIKNELSHRARAIKKLSDFLMTLGF